MARPRKSKKVMSEIFTLRLTPEQQELISGFVQGNTAGTISVDKVRDVLTMLSSTAMQVKAGELTPEMAAGKFVSFFEALVSSSPHAEQVYLSPAKPGEEKPGDEEAR